MLVRSDACIWHCNRSERQALFRWLPACNFGVMLLALLYQAPFESILGHKLGPRQVGTRCKGDNTGWRTALHRHWSVKCKGEDFLPGGVFWRAQGCNVAHVLGLYKMAGGNAALSLSARGALADMALWGIFRLQTRLFASRTYDRCAARARSCATHPPLLLAVLRVGGSCRQGLAAGEGRLPSDDGSWTVVQELSWGTSVYPGGLIKGPPTVGAWR